MAWLAGELAHGRFAPPDELLGLRERTVELAVAQKAADVHNAALAFGLFGAALGLGLGVAGGLARRSGRAAAAAWPWGRCYRCWRGRPSGRTAGTTS